MDELDRFKSEVEAFLKRTGMAASRFGDEACKDSAFVIDLRAGREPRFSMIRRVRGYIERYGAETAAKLEAEAVAERATTTVTSEASP